MGLLFTKLVKLFMDEEHKVIVVGLDNAGKTTILYQFLMNEVYKHFNALLLYKLSTFLKIFSNMIFEIS